MRKALLVAIVVAVGGVAGYAGFRAICPAPTALTSAAGSLAFANQTVSGTVLCNVEGMKGGCCAAPVQSALLSVEGVEKVECNGKAGTAQVTIKAGRSIQAAQLAKALEGSNYYRLASVKPLKTN